MLLAQLSPITTDGNGAGLGSYAFKEFLEAVCTQVVPSIRPSKHKIVLARFFGLFLLTELDRSGLDSDVQLRLDVRRPPAGMERAVSCRRVHMTGA